MKTLTPLAAVLAACGNAAQQTDGSWLTNCPVHGDSNPSLLISEDDDGKVLIVCRSQRCPTADVVKAWGLTMRDLFPQGDEAPKPPPGAPTRGDKPIAIYDYVNRDGVLVYQVLKYHGDPRFRQRRPSHKEPPSDLWIWNLDGAPSLPYRAPEVAAAVAFGHRVYVVEGEKDADAIAALGLVATTNSGGAGSWTPECTAALTGACAVTIIPDNDSAGEKHARAVREALTGRAARVRILRLPNLRTKGDVSDWIEAGGTADKLEAMASAGPDTRGWTRAGALVAEPMPDVDWIIQGLLARPSLAVVSGDADAFKSWSLTELCIAASAEGRWFGHFPISGRRSMLVTADEDRAETRRKIAWLAKGMELSDDDMAALSENMLVWTDDLAFDDDESFARLEEDVEDHAPDLIIVDHLRVCFEGKEDSSEFARKIKLRGRALYRRHPCCVVWVHHVRKLSAEKGLNTARQRIRGSGGIVQSVDHHLAFERADDTDVAVVVVDRNKKGRRMAPFSIHARIADGDGRAAMEWGGDAKFAGGTSAEPGKVLALMRTPPIRAWRIAEIETALGEEIHRNTVRNALKNLAAKQLVTVSGTNRNTIYTALETGDWKPPYEQPYNRTTTVQQTGKLFGIND